MNWITPRLANTLKTGETEKNIWYDTVEDAPRVPKSVLARRKLPEVPRRQWHYVVIKLKDDTAGRFGIYCDVKLRIQKLESKRIHDIHFPHKNVGPVTCISIRGVKCESSRCKCCNYIHILTS